MAIVRIGPQLGIEFLLAMDEGVIWVRANFPEGTSLTQSSRYGRRIREIALEYPDVEFVTIQAGRTVELVREVPGARDVNIEQEGPQPQLVITPNRRSCARHNVKIEDVVQLINVALGGEPLGLLYEGERRFAIVARFDRSFVTSPAVVERLPVHNADGVAVPLAQVADIRLVDGQSTISREGGRRRITVRCDVVGRDQGGFVREAQERFDAEIRPLVPGGTTVAWLGMFENLERARNHFALLIPLTAAIIFGLLLITFRSLPSALLVLAGIPFACVGALVALWLRDMHVNVSTGVGFCALFGIAIMDGVLMVRGTAGVIPLE